MLKAKINEKILKATGEKQLRSIHKTYPLPKKNFKSEDEIKTFSNKQKQRKFIASRPALQEILQFLSLMQVT